MPAKGGNPTLSDYEVARAVVYMANKSGASLPEPAAPAEEGAKKEEAAAPAAAAPAPPRRLLPLPPRPSRLPQQRPPRRCCAAPQQAAVNPAGEKLYKSVCFACHATGVANAPSSATRPPGSPTSRPAWTRW